MNIDEWVADRWIEIARIEISSPNLPVESFLFFVQFNNLASPSDT